MPLSHLSSLQHNASCYLTPPSIPDHARSAIFAAAQEQQGHHFKVSSARTTQSSLAVAPNRGKKSHPSKGSWITESQAPLTKAEEHVLCSDVQDLLFLESKRVELNKVLGRISTEQEWAEFVGCTVFRLYARIAKGRAAKRKMIAANLPLVGSLAKEFHGRGLSYNELCQEGALGLVKSTEKFDVSYNTKFSTYAYFWIRERMLSATQNFRQIWRVGGSIRKTVTFILQSKDHFRQQHGRNPSMDELAAFSNTDKLKIKQAFSAIRPGRRSDQGGYKYYNGLSKEPEACESDLPWPVLWQSEVKDELKRLICGLTPRESQVLIMKYGLHGGSPSSLVQIAANLGVSHEAVRMFEIKALKKLRRSAEETGLKQYLWKVENSKAE